MNRTKAAAALNTISLAFAELAEAIDSSETGTPPAAVGAAGIPPPAAPSSMPEFPPMEALEEAPISERAVEAHGSWVCPIHGTHRIVPAGVSKRTGKPYSAFITCGERDCDEKPRGKAA